jgi:hypothetical protein
LHFEQNAGIQNERNASKHLIGNAEQRPQGIDTA